MSQQTPPHNPEDAGQNPYGSQEPSFAQSSSDENPYFGQRRATTEPDLDAGSPVLTSAEARRLNRKALLFLGGIVLLLLFLGYFVLWGGKEKDDEPATPTRGEVTVPQAPTTPPLDLAPPEDTQQPIAEAPPVPLAPPEDPDLAAPSRRSADNGPRPPSLMDRRMASAGSSSGQAAAGGAGGDDAGVDPGAEMVKQMQQIQAMQNASMGLPPGGIAAPTVASASTNAQFLSNPNALLMRGTYLRCVLETRIITDVPGFTSCILTEPVYSVNGKQLLLPKGSKILGQYSQGEDGIARVSVVWDRIVTPTGLDVTMSSPGVDGLGAAGHPGKYSGHWAQKIASALLISLISDGFQWAAAEHGPESSTTYSGPGGTTVVTQPFQSATARSMERLANQALQKSAARPGTVTINQGTVVNVYVSQDVDFSSVMAVR